MRIIVVYDISENKRRERLRKTLLRFGNPVQKSVFECDLSQRQTEKMERAIRAVMSGTEDNIRYYKICKNCAGEVEVFGGRPLETTKTAYIV
jgi:CRISPR-associated protein Cas2